MLRDAWKSSFGRTRTLPIRKGSSMGRTSVPAGIGGGHAGLLIYWDWARGTLTGWQDEGGLNRRGRFALTRNAAPHVPSVRARLELARSAVEPPTPRNYDLRLRRRRTEDQRPPLEQLDVISRCAGARRPYEATRGRRNRGRLQSSRCSGSRDSSRVSPNAGRGGRGALGGTGRARRFVPDLERRAISRGDLYARSVAVDCKNRCRHDHQTQGGCDGEPGSPRRRRRRGDRPRGRRLRGRGDRRVASLR